MADTPERDQLAKLEERIDAVTRAHTPPPPGRSKYEVTSLAWRMVLELVIGMGLGCFIGFGLDTLLGTLPIFLVIFALLGFAAGIRTMMRTAEEVERTRRKGIGETE